MSDLRQALGGASLVRRDRRAWRAVRATARRAKRSARRRRCVLGSRHDRHRSHRRAGRVLRRARPRDDPRLLHARGRPAVAGRGLDPPRLRPARPGHLGAEARPHAQPAPRGGARLRAQGVGRGVRAARGRGAHRAALHVGQRLHRQPWPRGRSRLGAAVGLEPGLAQGRRLLPPLPRLARAGPADDRAVVGHRAPRRRHLRRAPTPWVRWRGCSPSTARASCPTTSTTTPSSRTARASWRPRAAWATSCSCIPTSCTRCRRIIAAPRGSSPTRRSP